MINQKIISIIPARSGSKGLKDKNIRPFSGKPLLAHTISAAKESGVFDEIFVSTDSPYYAGIAKEYGASVPFLREYSLATDTASSWDVVKNALIQYQNAGFYFDVVILLQPTSPLRTFGDIQNALKLYCEKNANAVVSVCETNHSPLWTNTLPEDHSLAHFIREDAKNKPRQLLEKYYQINGALYIVNVDYLMKGNDIYGDNCFAYIMPKESSIDIDDELDFLIGELLMNKGRDSQR
jgi:CMP-N,N'-diacetyllegionaminic acid synthase